jgi:phenylacetate-CoA ligase
LNADMPLVRYAIGDRAASAPPDEPCACGRRLPQLRRIEGRSDDVVVTPEGRLVGRLDPVFKADLPIREAQIVQESLRLVRVKVVPAGELDAGAVRSVQERIQQRLGSSMEVVVETVTEIPRGPNGKFRAVVSLLPREPGRIPPAAADPKTGAATDGRAPR